jgi:hypothetical protein
MDFASAGATLCGTPVPHPVSTTQAAKKLAHLIAREFHERRASAMGGKLTFLLSPDNLP